MNAKGRWLCRMLVTNKQVTKKTKKCQKSPKPNPKETISQTINYLKNESGK